jgi:hypothetical protein
LSTIVRKATLSPSVAPPTGLESRSRTVSLASSRVSLTIGIVTVREVTPGLKVTVWLGDV